MELIETVPENVDVPKKEKKKFIHPKKTAEERKKEKEQRQSRKARIILRNLPYKATEKELRDEFAKYGTIKDCNILKRADGKLVGCAFIQYEKVNQAAKAIHHGNNKPLLGRSIAIDWAVNRKKFADHLKQSKKSGIKSKTNKHDDDDDDDDDDDLSIKSEPADDGSVKEGEKSADESNEENSDESDADDNASENESQSDKDDDEKKPIHQKSNDVAEGCTVFIKNVPFEATSEDLRKVCGQFGALYYALITNDKVSGHSKGNGFVKFRAKESADMCLNAGTSFKLFDQILDPHLALSRNEIHQKLDNKKKEPVDSRNLYLAKEGLIAAGTPAVEGVSPSDMAKRLRLEQSKSQSLKNLNRFISKERLTVHNIPPSYDSAKLRQVIAKACGSKLKECRVMRENKPSVGHPLGKSKGYGFLSFKSHNDALNCLRKVNNNPKVFGKNNRPIVSFSIEDRAVHNIKMKRMQKSQECNPLFKGNKKTTKIKADIKPTAKSLKSLKNKPTVKSAPKENDTNLAEFAGSTAEKGGKFKSRPLWKLREEAASHSQTVGKEKKEIKQAKQQKEIRQEKRQIERPKMGKRKADVDSTLVNKYLKMLHSHDDSQPKSKRTKWYTE